LFQIPARANADGIALPLTKSRIGAGIEPIVVNIAQTHSSPMWHTTARRHLMAIRVSALIQLLKTLPGNAIVRGCADGLSIKEADETGEVVMLNDNFHIPAKTTLSKAGYPLAC
jgi:hypothetical protein